MQGEDYVILSFILKCSPNVSKKKKNTKALRSLQWAEGHLIGYNLNTNIHPPKTNKQKPHNDC